LTVATNATSGPKELFDRFACLDYGERTANVALVFDTWVNAESLAKGAE
jgi:hypothetical protein